MTLSSRQRFPALNFAPRQTWPLWLIVALLAAAVAVALGLHEWMGLRRMRASDEAAWAAVSRKQASPTPAATARPLPKELVQGVNDAIMDLNTPWPALLGAIESVRSDAISLALLEPQAREQRVRISAQADTMDALVDFMESLGHTAPFDSALPLRQEVAVPVNVNGVSLSPSPAVRRHQLTFELHWSSQP